MALIQGRLLFECALINVITVIMNTKGNKTHTKDFVQERVLPRRHDKSM